jgi:hypothetical protein
MNCKCAMLAALLSLLSMPLPVLAHHSFTAEFNAGKEVKITGVFTKLEWANPHIYLYLDAKDDSGKVVTWVFESGPPNALHRAGVRKDDFKIGDTVTVTAAACKIEGKPYGFLRTIKYSDGHVFEYKLGENN